MKTNIKTVHEEEYSDKTITLGILFNYSTEIEYKNWKDSYIYVYHKGMYTFFNTIVDMIDYHFYRESKMKRAYMSEKDFDNLYDADFIDGPFVNKLTWTSN